ncbi:MAG: alpha/beta fold hydrolase, partial [Deltaproteobacteria bacterium]|nr:alpha/beta fold hydrolase [Deltaproteobacteria bacterium]
LGIFGQDLFAEKRSIPCPQDLRIAGIKIQFCARGEGPPVLFLHGLGGSWKDWAANFFPLSSAYQVTAIDFPGFGDSDKPEVEYSIDWLTEIVEKFLQERKVTRVNIVGHSMGGLVALNLAARSNSPVKTLVVTDVVGVGRTPDGNRSKKRYGENSNP